MKRFDPERVDRAVARAGYNLGEDDFVLGIVARMQRHRKFEILLEAMRQAMKEEPSLRLLIVGRGTHKDEVAVQPVENMGLGDRILFTGYLQGDAYTQALAAMDCALFLVPGTDGSCRAVREKMAMGLPVIAADTPPLNEMVVTGENGFLVEPTVEGLKAAVLEAARNRDRMEAMAARSLGEARERFSLEVQARRVEQFYERILG
jgi:glycosyltransferase involved in cell wall biosynthesis